MDELKVKSTCISFQVLLWRESLWGSNGGRKGVWERENTKTGGKRRKEIEARWEAKAQGLSGLPSLAPGAFM